MIYAILGKNFHEDIAWNLWLPVAANSIVFQPYILHVVIIVPCLVAPASAVSSKHEQPEIDSQEGLHHQQIEEWSVTA